MPCRRQTRLVISIHAPSRERRGYLRVHRVATSDFNPRSLAGATALVLPLRLLFLFQSTLPRGSDHHTGSTKHWHRTFQSTLPRGSDGYLRVHRVATSDFNPRSLAGATALVLPLRLLFLFQSTLPRGSDHHTGSTKHWHRTFQSTLPRGSDIAALAPFEVAEISIHAPSRERP